MQAAKQGPLRPPVAGGTLVSLGLLAGTLSWLPSGKPGPNVADGLDAVQPMSALFNSRASPGIHSRTKPSPATWRMPATSHLPAVVPDDLAPASARGYCAGAAARVPSGAVASPEEGCPSTWNATRAIT